MGLTDRLFSQGAEILSKVRVTTDSWANTLTGFGTWRDKTTHSSFAFDNLLTTQQCRDLYHGDDIARKIVAFRPCEMLRQGIRVEVDGAPDVGKAVIDALTRLDALRRVRDAMIWGRCYGGGALIVGADDGQPVSEPLREENIGSIKFLHVVSRRSMMPNRVRSDVLTDDFSGDVQLYDIVPALGGSPITVHRSRMLLFGGAHTDEEIRAQNDGFDLSVLQAPYEILRDFQSVWKAGAVLMQEASQAVYSISGFLDMVASGKQEELHRRMNMIDMSRSILRAIVLDKDKGETFARQATSFTDAQQMLDRYMLRMAAAAELPVTLLMGREPAGQNATGDADFRYFYDTVRTAQQNDLYPQLQRLVRLFMLAADGPTRGQEPDVWSLAFPPLWQMTPAEQADLELKHAQKDVLYLQNEVLQPEEVALSRFHTEGFNPTITVDRQALQMTKQDAWRQDPFPHEHAARQTEPGKYTRFVRKHLSGWPEGLDAIFGVKADGTTEIQTIRARSDKWTVSEFRVWLEAHHFKTTIEPATGK